MELAAPAWKTTDLPPPIGEGEVQVWRVRAEPEGEDPWAPLLPHAERERLGRFHFAADARRESAGRGALRRLLGAHLGLAPDQVALAAGPTGKPGLAGSASASRLEFNVSHSGHWALIALARGRRLGVDVEAWRAAPEDSSWDGYFRPDELAELRGWPASEREAAFYGAWTLKEAYLKALGAGLSLPLASFRVAFAPVEPARLLACSREAPERWLLLRLEAGAGYSAALAAERPIDRVSTFTLNPASKKAPGL